MAISKCISCGGTFDAGNNSYVQCPHCGTAQNVAQPAQAAPQQVPQQFPQQFPQQAAQPDAAQQAQAAQFAQTIAQNEKKSKKKIILIVIAAVLAVSFIPLCILAAMLVPSLLAYTDNANQKSFMEACDTIKTSVWTEYTNEYAESGKSANQFNIDWDAVSDIAGLDVSNNSDTEYTVSFTMSGSTMSSMTVTSDNYRGTWSSSTSSWTVTEY